MNLPFPLSSLVGYCENLCVKECCGIESFDFSPVHLASWLHQFRGQPEEQTLRELDEQLDEFRSRCGTGSSESGYESGENEMNQMLSASEVDQLVDQLKTNIVHAVDLKQQSISVEWKAESISDSNSIEHHPELGNRFLRALLWRYATKKFDPDRSLRQDDIETILEATNLSASSYGLQPYQYVLIQNKSIQEKLVDVSYGQLQVRDASAVIVFAIRTNIDADYIHQCARETETIRGLEPGQLDDYAKIMVGSIMGMDEKQRDLWATRQCYISMGTALAACAMLGVDACPMEGIVPDSYDEILGLKEKNLHAVLGLPIGYRSSEDINSRFAKVRKPLEEIVVRIS